MGIPMPMSYPRLTRVLIATIVMAIVVRSLELVLHLGDKDALAVLRRRYRDLPDHVLGAQHRQEPPSVQSRLLIVRNALAR